LRCVERNLRCAHAQLLSTDQRAATSWRGRVRVPSEPGDLLHPSLPPPPSLSLSLSTPPLTRSISISLAQVFDALFDGYGNTIDTKGKGPDQRQIFSGGLA